MAKIDRWWLPTEEREKQAKKDEKKARRKANGKRAKIKEQTGQLETGSGFAGRKEDHQRE